MTSYVAEWINRFLICTFPIFIGVKRIDIVCLHLISSVKQDYTESHTIIVLREKKRQSPKELHRDLASPWSLDIGTFWKLDFILHSKRLEVRLLVD
jgi:hypothetical protein